MTTRRSAPELVQQAVEEVPQAIFAHAGAATLDQVDELVEALQGAAVRDVMAMRVEQIVKHGHNGERDAKKPVGELSRLALQFGHEACQLIEAGPERRDLAAARRKLIRQGAATLAAIDRVDAEIRKEKADG